MENGSRTALITGGAKGIGRGIVLHLLAAGWRVAALDRDGAALAALPEPGPLLRLTADVSREDTVRAALKAVSEWAGGLDLLVNNAGLAGPEAGPLEALDLSEWQRWLDTNLTGAMLMSKHAIPLLRPRRGSIVNITSTRAFMSEPQTEPYAAAKGGLTALTHAMAISLGPQIRVNAVAPGWIDTQGTDLRPEDHAQHPAGRVGRPEDVAGAVAWLADAGFVTGQTVTVDGGMTARMIYVE